MSSSNTNNRFMLATYSLSLGGFTLCVCLSTAQPHNLNNITPRLPSPFDQQTKPINLARYRLPKLGICVGESRVIVGFIGPLTIGFRWRIASVCYKNWPRHKSVIVTAAASGGVGFLTQIWKEAFLE